MKRDEVSRRIHNLEESSTQYDDAIRAIIKHLGIKIVKEIPDDYGEAKVIKNKGKK